MAMYMTQGLHRSVQQHPDRVATIFEQRRRSYREFVDRVARLATALQRVGMKRNDRVAMLGLNSDRYLEFYYGVWWGGGAVNPVNIRWTASEISYSLDDCDTRILLVDDRFKDMVPEISSASRRLQTVVYAGDGETPGGMINYEEILARVLPSQNGLRSSVF